MSDLTVSTVDLKRDQPTQTGRKHSNNNKITKKKAGLVETLLLISVIPAIFFGINIQSKQYLTAEEGLGYWLGIIGGTMMLIILLYPLRKHTKSMRNLGSVRVWFRVHMVFGIVGPVTVLYHSNFTLGSVNSNIALFSMIIVACSGFFGRYIYSKIHHGLYGSKATLAEMQKQLQISKNKIEHFFSMPSKELLSPLHQFEDKFLPYCNQPFHSLFVVPLLPWFSLYAYYQFRKKINEKLERTLAENKVTEKQSIQIRLTLQSYSKNYLKNTSRVIEFVVYERIFSFWHMLHLPLFIIMISTGLFHVYAVHLY